MSENTRPDDALITERMISEVLPRIPIDQPTWVNRGEGGNLIVDGQGRKVSKPAML